MAQELNIALPGALDLGPAYTIRVTALNTSGNTVSGVNIGAVTLTADFVNAQDAGGGGTLSGDWFLVPGPGA